MCVCLCVCIHPLFVFISSCGSCVDDLLQHLVPLSYCSCVG